VRTETKYVLESLAEIVPLAQRFAELQASHPTSPVEPAPERAPVMEILDEEEPWSIPDSLGDWQRLREFVDDFFPEGQAFVQAVEAWAVGFNLNADWVLDIARSTLGRWVADPQALRERLWEWPDFITKEPLSEVERQFQFMVKWEAPFEAWDDFRGLAESYFEAELQRFRTKVEGLLQERGWQDEQVRQPQDFRWLVLYQIEGLGRTEILERLCLTKTDPKTISEGYRRAAKRIGLTLRPGPGKGRPSKKM
jgi:hypothetical protein